MARLGAVCSSQQDVEERGGDEAEEEPERGMAGGNGALCHSVKGGLCRIPGGIPSGWGVLWVLHHDPPAQAEVRGTLEGRQEVKSALVN